MNITIQFIRFCTFSVSWFAVGISPAQSNEPREIPVDERHEAFSRLQSLWNQQRDRIQTAHLKYYLVRGATKPLPDEDLASNLDFSSLVETPTNLASLAQELRREVAPGNQRHWLVGVMELWQEGDRTREDNTANGIRVSEVVVDEVRLEYLSYINQATVSHSFKTRVAQANVDSYRFVTPNYRESDIKGAWRYSDGRVMLQVGEIGDFHSLLTFSSQTGGLLNAVTTNPSGDIIRRIIQAHFIEHANGVIFPGLFASFECRNGVVKRMCVAVFESAVFNEAIPRDVFKLMVPRGAVIVDARNGTQSMRPTFARANVNDLLTFTDAANLLDDPARNGSGFTRVLGLIATVLLVLVLAVFVGRKQLPAR